MKVKRVLSVLAHPDDAEILCAGTLALLRRNGWEVHIATMTPGQAGSATLGPDEIAAVRRKEGADAAAVLEGAYSCLEFEDALVRHDRETFLKVLALVRRVEPGLVLAHGPRDHLLDHEASSLVVRDAVFWSTVRNIATPGAGALRAMPHLYYCDPLDGADIFGDPIRPTAVVDISSVIETKTTMLARHTSQRDWLRKQHGNDEYLEAMKEMSRSRGALVGAPTRKASASTSATPIQGKTSWPRNWDRSSIRCHEQGDRGRGDGAPHGAPWNR